MEKNSAINFPPNFLLDITTIQGSSDKVCLQTIEHYKKFEEYPDPVVQEIAKAMVGNLTEYYSVSHEGSPDFNLALPHLSHMANFMDSQSTAHMDIQSTARIKSFFSTYEKLLGTCAMYLEKHEPIPTSSLCYDIIATRDVLYPRYHFQYEPQLFYRSVYGVILKYMEEIDQLSQTTPGYGFAEVDLQKRIELSRPHKITFEKDEETYTVPELDFIDYALDIKGIPNIYRPLSALHMSDEDILENIKNLQKDDISAKEILELPLIQAMKSNMQKSSLIEFRNRLEEEFIDNLPDDNKKMFKDYGELSTEDFMYVYRRSVKPELRDYLKIIDAIDKAVEAGTYQVNFGSLITSGEASENQINTLLDAEAVRQEFMLQERISQLNELDISNFDEHIKQARKIHHFAAASKDYMRYPKGSGYQSFHIIVNTPFGQYEKQIRTEAQHHFAEHGEASHSKTYKPYEKENFHRLKLPTPLMPKIDDRSDILLPIELEPVSFDEAIKAYYHKPFEYFSNDISMEEFKKLHPYDFDDAILALSQITGKMIERVNVKFSRILPTKKRTPFFQPKTTVDLRRHAPKGGSSIVVDTVDDFDDR